MLEKLFIKDYKNVESAKVRSQYGYLASGVGLLLNILLATAKIVVGTLFASVSVLADGLNNLTDGGSLAISLVGFKVANLPADSKHPYGHRRIEYVTSLVISIIIIIIGIELFGSSIEGIVTPVAKEYSLIVVGILVASIVLKLWLGLFNYRLSKKIDSLSLKATATDSLNDSFVTLAVLISTLVGMYAGVDLDGYCGIVVSLFILFAGASLVKETISPLLGQTADKSDIEELIKQIRAYDGVMGVHDVQAHNYGPNKYFVTLHVEVDRNVDVMESHELIDKIESDLNNDNLHVVIHMDPIVVNDPVLDEYKVMEQKLVKDINEKSTLHDFRMVDGKQRINLIFDVVVPFADKRTDDEIKQLIETKTKEKDEKLFTVVNVDRF